MLVLSSVRAYMGNETINSTKRSGPKYLRFYSTCGYFSNPFKSNKNFSGKSDQNKRKQMSFYEFYLSYGS